MLRVIVLLGVALLAFVRPCLGDEARVQARWRVAGVAISTSSVAAVEDAVVRRALSGAAATVERELPGLTWQVESAVRRASYVDDRSGSVRAGGAGIRRAVERLLARDEALARVSVLFVYAPLHGERLFGLALQRARAGTRRVWYAVVNTAPGEIVATRVPVGALAPVARGAMALPCVRDLVLRATTVHEFGHFLAPGTRDVRAVERLTGWIHNGPDEPDRHDRSCVMWTPDRSSLLAKLRAFPRLVGFCDRCRERCGLRPRRRFL